MSNRLNLKILFILLLVLIFGKSAGQKINCFCEKDSLMNESVSCDTIVLKNHSKLYWQLNCDRIWLTLETPKNQKIVLDEPDVDLYGYVYRLGFHLIREFKNTLLFRSGCSASGPCSYILIDKTTGKQIEEYGQLICIDTDSRYEGESYPYPFDFIVYLDFINDKQYLIVYFIDTKKTIRIRFKENLTAITPQEQFDTMGVKNNMLIIHYKLDDNQKKSVSIKL